MNNTIANNRPSELVVYDRVLKATSLLYFKDALLNQRYEDCAELIRAAKSFGAQSGEISRIMTGVINGESGGQNEAYRNKPSRRRF